MRWFKIISVLFTALILQTVVLARLNIWGVIPDLILVVVIILAVREEAPANIISLAALAGFLLDVFSGGPYFNMLLLIIVATLVCVVKQSFTEDEYSFILTLVGTLTSATLLLGALFLNSFAERTIILPNLLLNMVLQTFYNLLLVPICWPLLKKYIHD